MNMSYCRFQNTVTDLADCMDALEEIDYNLTKLSADEEKAARRKACRFESGPGHHGSTALVLRATCASFRQPFPQNGYFGHASRISRASFACWSACPASA